MRNLQDLKTAIGQKVRALRNERGWSQEELAAHAETGISYVSEIENGKGNLTLQTFWQLAKAFEVEVKVLFDF